MTIVNCKAPSRDFEVKFVLTFAFCPTIQNLYFLCRILSHVSRRADQYIIINEVYDVYQSQCDKAVSLWVFSRTLKKLFPPVRKNFNKCGMRAMQGLAYVSPSQSGVAMPLAAICSRLQDKWAASVTDCQLRVMIPTEYLCDGAPVNKEVIVSRSGEVECTIMQRPANLAAVGIVPKTSLTPYSVMAVLTSVSSLRVCQGYNYAGPGAKVWSRNGDSESRRICKNSKKCIGLIKITSTKILYCVICKKACKRQPNSTNTMHQANLAELTGLMSELGLPADVSELLFDQARNTVQCNAQSKRWTPR